MAKGYDIAVCSLGSAWFLLLALVLARKTFGIAAGMHVADFGPVGWLALVSSVCLTLFYVSLWGLMLIRPAPTAWADGVIPSLVAFAGSYLPWTIPLLTTASTSAGQNLLSAIPVITGTILMVFVVFHLGRSFSIVPQARKLVRTGPYAIVRNPLYLAEEVAMLGVLIKYCSTTTLLLFLAHAVMQVWRIFHEEKLLYRAFADYDDYTKSTRRLIPYVW
jgi:protein-S-isoprenylcysteine O-methyltransferase Ste14